MGGFVYIMTNKPLGVLYIGVTSSLADRVLAHREGRGSAFCKQWDLRRLVYVEPHPTIDGAIAREKAIKNWRRLWKLRLISETNPNWDDLFDSINS